MKRAYIHRVARLVQSIKSMHNIASAYDEGTLESVEAEIEAMEHELADYIDDMMANRARIQNAMKHPDKHPEVKPLPVRELKAVRCSSPVCYTCREAEGGNVKKAIVALFVVACLVPLKVQAQGIEFGLGLGAPIGSKSVVMEAKVDGSGIVRATRTMDSSPSLVVELHKPFKVGPKFAIGPMIAFTPSFNLGVSSNETSEQPVRAGFGVAIQIPSRLKQHINVGVLYAITPPISQLAPGWADGYQAPRSRLSDQPLPPEFIRGSVGQVMFVMTVSGFFGGK